MRDNRRSQPDENPAWPARAEMSWASRPAPRGDGPQNSSYGRSLDFSMRLYNSGICELTSIALLCPYSSTCVNRVEDTFWLVRKEFAPINACVFRLLRFVEAAPPTNLSIELIRAILRPCVSCWRRSRRQHATRIGLQEECTLP